MREYESIDWQPEIPPDDLNEEVMYRLYKKTKSALIRLATVQEKPVFDLYNLRSDNYLTWLRMQGSARTADIRIGWIRSVESQRVEWERKISARLVDWLINNTAQGDRYVLADKWVGDAMLGLQKLESSPDGEKGIVEKMRRPLRSLYRQIVQGKMRG